MRGTREFVLTESGKSLLLNPVFVFIFRGYCKKIVIYIGCIVKELCTFAPEIDVHPIMSERNLVIVESPAKAKTIERFLGKGYTVVSSYGHIRDLKTKGLSVDETTLEPDYEVPSDKGSVVSSLRSAAAKADKVWLASDEDREGEAISWHLCEVLGLDERHTNRIVFHEITKSAILDAIAHPRHLDMNLVNAQQARRILDRIVGFKLSPVLWRKVKPALSAGRVQSVAVRLVVEREREIQHFEPENFFRVYATFIVPSDEGGQPSEIRAEIVRRFTSREEAIQLLDSCQEATFTVGDIQRKPLKRAPAPPFTTSTLQQEAARRLGFTVSQTMRVAQRLYESGRITYMRTDSVNLSTLCLSDSKRYIDEHYGSDYSRTRNFQTKAKGAQEAHEAIRPTSMEVTEISGTQQEKRLYELIWKRTIASQMAEAQIEKTTVNIHISGTDEIFVATGETILFDGFLKVYSEKGEILKEERGERREEKGTFSPAANTSLPQMTPSMTLMDDKIFAIERFTQAPPRYTEASLVHKMEELGIGRPSTYAPTISTIQQREYVIKGEKNSESRTYTLLTLAKGRITEEQKTDKVVKEKGKLIPTDIGMVVNDFLLEHFNTIMDYNFTATLEQEFDRIAEGKSEWKTVLHKFYDTFAPVVAETMNSHEAHKVGERVLGIDPVSGREVLVKIARFGPVVQIGRADEAEKPLFADMPKGISMEDITLEQALDVFKLPRTLGQFEGTDVQVNVGRYGPYVRHNGKFVSLDNDMNPMTITLSNAVALIERKRIADRQKHIKTLEGKENIDIMNGKFGPYLIYDGTNYRIPKPQQKKAAELTYEQCMEIIEAAPKNDTSKKKRSSGRAKK